MKAKAFTLAQSRGFYDQIADNNSPVLRSIDINGHIQKTVCKPSDSGSKTTEYVVTVDANLIPDAINVIITGEGMNLYMQLKHIARSISSIQCKQKKPHPPNP